jgi:hypothetical protein
MSAASPARTITLDMPEALYERVQHAAATLKRRVEEVLLDVVATALPPLDDLPKDIADDLAALPFLNDAALFQVAKSAVSPALHAEMTSLLDRKGSGEIAPAEQGRLDDLVREHEVLALRRAQAALLLRRRGYDMSNPGALSRLP